MILLLLLLLLAFVPGCSSSSQSAGDVPAATAAAAAPAPVSAVAVQSAAVEVRELQRTVEAVGSLDPNEEITAIPTGWQYDDSAPHHLASGAMPSTSP